MAQHESHAHDNHPHGARNDAGHGVKDPVCGMTVDRKHPVRTAAGLDL